jgi:hypothetical protein
MMKFLIDRQNRIVLQWQLTILKIGYSGIDESKGYRKNIHKVVKKQKWSLVIVA